MRDWLYDEESGTIHNEKRSFFEIAGLRSYVMGECVASQPILLQNEIGYLGIICRNIDGVMHFLMQAKIEPGNINNIQISPTIQATKSNFTQKHGGKRPNYLEYFNDDVAMEDYGRSFDKRIIVDQIQSEQSSRFLKKRNRNIMIEVFDDVPVLPSHKWMTLSQIKQLMLYDNLVNMDTRTVLSCIPFYSMTEKELLIFVPEEDRKDPYLWRSVKGCGKTQEQLAAVFGYINDRKMFDERSYEVVPMFSLDNWHMENGEFVCRDSYSFKVVFCDIEIAGREVVKWEQPLFEATGIATFGLLTCVDDGIRKFLVKAKPEIGCFDSLEIGPSVQREHIEGPIDKDRIDEVFDTHLKDRKDIIFDQLLSEEGGRFYHEQNRNVIVEVDKDEIREMPKGYFWMNYHTLNELVQINNVLNIQLRNLLSVVRS
jgi:oxidase EvaA